jgi:hypothetical protein
MNQGKYLGKREKKEKRTREEKQEEKERKNTIAVPFPANPELQANKSPPN